MALTNTVLQIITEAYKTVGIVPEGGTPSSDQQTTGLLRFNALMHTFVGLGIDTWSRTINSFSLVADQAAYSIGPSGVDVTAPRPIFIHNIYRRDSDSIDTPLTKISVQEYNQYSDKSSSGVPTQFMYRPLKPNGTLTVWPVPASTDLPLTLYYDAMIPYTANSIGEVPNFPDEWQMAVIYNLAKQFADINGRPIPPNVAQDAKIFLDLAQGLDYEDAPVRMVPDFRSQAMVSRYG